MKKLVGILFGLIVAVSGLLLTACGDPYKNMKIVADSYNLEMVVGEERQLVVSVLDVPNRVSTNITASPDGEFVSILNYESLSGGRTRITIKAIKIGEGEIKIETSEGGNKSITISVVVTENIQNFYKNSTKAYIVRSDGFEMDLSPKALFNFIPENSTQTDLVYYYTVNETDYQVDKIVCENVGEDGEELPKVRIYCKNDNIFDIDNNQFTLKASSLINPDIESQSFTVDIIEDIVVNEMLLTNLGGTDIANPTQIVPIGENAESGQASEITLVSNDEKRSNAQVKLIYTSSNVKLSINYGCEFTIAQLLPEDQDSNNVVFNLQTVYVGEDVLTITLYYDDYPSFKVVKSYKINVISSPSFIGVRELEDDGEINLYDKNYNANIANFNLTPIIYSTESTFEKIQIDFCDENEERIENWTDYVSLSYKNVVRKPNEYGYIEILYSDFKNNVLISPISLLGQQIYDGELRIRFTVVSSTIQQGQEVDKTYKINILQGASEFKTNYPTNEEILYIDLNTEPHDFDNFTFTNGAYVGILTFKYVNASYFTVEQVTNEEKPKIKITPLSVGSGGKVIIYLPNGLSTEVYVNVESILQKTDFAVQMNDNIVSFEETTEI